MCFSAAASLLEWKWQPSWMQYVKSELSFCCWVGRLVLDFFFLRGGEEGSLEASGWDSVAVSSLEDALELPAPSASCSISSSVRTWGVPSAAVSGWF